MKEDRTTTMIAGNCLDVLGVVWKELQVLEPRHLIFMTGRDYDGYLVAYADRHRRKDIHGIDTEVPIGSKRMPWWEFEMRWSGASEAERVRAVRIGHPERKKKAEWIRRVREWLAETS